MDGRGRRPAPPVALPPVTRALLVANAIVQLALTLGGSAVREAAIEGGGLIPARLSGSWDGASGALPPVLTLLTAQFLHVGWLHLAANALFLSVVARFVEPALGPRHYLALYLVGGVAGNFAEALAAPSSHIVAVGASGAIAAVFGAYVMRFAARAAPLPGSRARSEWAVAARFLAAWVGLQALVALAGLEIAVFAHVGGFIVGLVAGARARQA